MIQTPLIPRYYQYESTEAVVDYFVQGGTGNPMVVLPTGAGKSICVAELTKRIMTWPDQRVIMLTHVKELIEQNVNKLYRQWPEAPAGIHSASLRRRDVHDDIIFAGIQSVYKKSFDLGGFNIIIIDECHLISPNATTMYQKFIEDQRSINPFVKVVGYTATPFRTGTGDITTGDGTIFNDICYEKPMIELIDEGYLAPLISKRTETDIDLSKVKKSGGDFQQKALQTATNKPSITQSAVREIIAYGETRRSWLLFCAGIDHAKAVNDELEASGIRSKTVTGKTPPAERQQILDEFKSGKIRAVTNCDVLTTGFDAPETDLIALLRGTQSPGLYVQMCGRGTRPVYASGMPIETNDERVAAIEASTKKNCLVLDFAGNVMRHGPVDQVRPWIPNKGGGGEAPSKVCPQCDTITYAFTKVCNECDYEFPFDEAEKHNATSGDDAIMSTESPIEEVAIQKASFLFWEGRKAIPTVRCSYLKAGTMTVQFHEWIPLFHTNADSRFAVNRAQSWWKRFVGIPFPEFNEWIDNKQKYAVIKKLLDQHYRPPKALVVNKSGKYAEIVNHIGVQNHDDEKES